MPMRTIPIISNISDYIWHEDWVKIPQSVAKPLNGRTHGIVYTIDNTILLFHQSYNALLTYSTKGELLSTVGGDRWLGAHGLSAYRDGKEEYYWLTDGIIKPFPIIKHALGILDDYTKNLVPEPIIKGTDVKSEPKHEITIEGNLRWVSLQLILADFSGRIIHSQNILNGCFFQQVIMAGRQNIIPIGF